MEILIYVILALLIGILIGWYLASQQTRRVIMDQESLKLKLATAEAEVKRLQSKTSETVYQAERVYIKADQLVDINGIGPVFAERLNKAGIYTFADLAAQSPERINKIISPKNWQAIDPAAWIAEAQQFSNGVG